MNEGSVGTPASGRTARLYDGSKLKSEQHARSLCRPYNEHQDRQKQENELLGSRRALETNELKRAFGIEAETGRGERCRRS